jgi:hypothetical protein
MNRSTRLRVRYSTRSSGALSCDSNAEDHDLCAGSTNPLHEMVSIVALVCDNRSGAQMLDQLRGTRDVGDLSFSDDQSQRATLRIHTKVCRRGAKRTPA